MNETASILPTAFLGLKILTLVGLFLYSIFAFVVFRQEQLMAGVLDEAFEPFLKVIVIVHFFASLGLLFLAFLIL
ncbi:MAG: DUF5657 family protein [Patescibacteria group bacterium]